MITKYKFDIFYDGKYYFKYKYPQCSPEVSIKFYTLQEAMQNIIQHKITDFDDTTIIFNFVFYLNTGIFAFTIKTDLLNFNTKEPYIRYMADLEKVEPFGLNYDDSGEVLLLKYDCTHDECYIKNTQDECFKNIKGYTQIVEYLSNQELSDFDILSLKGHTKTGNLNLSCYLKKDKDLKYIEEFKQIFKIIIMMSNNH